MENTSILISGLSDSDQEAVFLRFLILSEGIKNRLLQKTGKH